MNAEICQDVMILEILEMNEVDAERVAGTLRRGFRDVSERFDFSLERCPTFPAHCQAEWIIKEAQAGTRFFIAEICGQAVGCIGMKIDGGRFWMVRLAVVPEHRHCGLGRMLTQHIEQVAWQLHFKQVDIAVVAENDRLCAWYHQLGYRDREIKSYDHLPFTVVYMCKEAAHG